MDFTNICGSKLF